MRFAVLLPTLVSLSLAFNASFSNADVKNGTSTLLELEKEKGLKYLDVKLANKSFQIFDNPLDGNKQYALLPISYYEKPTKKLEVLISYMKDGEKNAQLMFLKVEDGKYKKEEIHVDSSKVNPKSKEVKSRISKEYNQAMKIYHTVTKKSYLNSEFIMPLESPITSNFGKARVYNGSLKGYHSGTDFRAKVGTPIVAANDAKVALVKDRFYSGGTVLLDHGEGIYTCYFHLSDFKVEENQMVKKGQVLGLSGKSGRVTGPHLHFSARINGVQIDPLQLLTLLNNNLLQGK